MIYKVQESVVELASKLDFRQRFQAVGMALHNIYNDPKLLIEWSYTSDVFFLKPWVIFLSRVLPIVTIPIGVLFFLTEKVPFLLLILLLIVQISFLAFKYKDVNNALLIADKYKDDIKTYDKVIELILKEQFDSKYLIELKGRLYNDKMKDAHRQISSLSRIVSDMVSMRNHQLYIVFNIFTLWDFQCEIALEKWKRDYGTHLKEWLEAIGEFEVLSSLSIIKHDHPEWTMPRIIKGPHQVYAKKLGHPLLHDDIRVCNDLDVDSSEGILIITGSNMSGKSTLLRTAGINLILAYIGAPVCAKEFQCALMDVYTSMRVSDNLEESISSFYAELLRVKLVIEACRKGKSVFFLLDEIFKGTNSMDRHTGAKVLIKTLSKENAIGLVSTHDLELGDMEEEVTGVKNYHFQEFYKDGQLNFDYKLRKGISKTRNAIYLMKMAGIVMDEQDM